MVYHRGITLHRRIHMSHNVVGWFEIPVVDMERAMAFYEQVIGVKIERHQMGPIDMGWFPSVEQGIGSQGSLVKHESYKPSADGVLIYFTSPTGNIDDDLERVQKAGGTVVMPKKQISEEYGYMGVFLDTEGNRIAVHSRTST